MTAPIRHPEPRCFVLHRTTDTSGVSGTGLVAYGVQFPTGRVALSWNSGVPTITAYDTTDDVLAIHGHQGATTLEWLDT